MLYLRSTQHEKGPMLSGSQVLQGTSNWKVFYIFKGLNQVGLQFFLINMKFSSRSDLLITGHFAF